MKPGRVPLHPLDLGQSRTALEPLEQSLNGAAGTFDEDFDPSVFQVSNPAREPQALGLPPGPGSKSHALHHAGHERPYRNVLHDPEVTSEP